MLCDSCFGTGFVLRRSYPGNALAPYPCETCSSARLLHCCEGERPGNVPAESVHPAMRVIGDLTPILKDQHDQGLHKKP